MKRIFISGALSNTDNTIFLNNCYKMLECANKVLNGGFAVYTPCLDVLMSLHGGAREHQEYCEHDLAWLEVCDALLLVDNPLNFESMGVAGEILAAKELGIPIFKSISELFDTIK